MRQLKLLSFSPHVTSASSLLARWTKLKLHLFTDAVLISWLGLNSAFNNNLRHYRV